MLKPVAESRREAPPEGAVSVGKLMAFDDQGRPLVDLPDGSAGWPVAARSTVPLACTDVGCEVALLFEAGSAARPIIVGLLQDPSRIAAEPSSEPPAEVRIDGQRLLLTGHREVVLRCGEASITLTRAGKILLQGKYLLNQSDGVNRIVGGSVEIN